MSAKEDGEKVAMGCLLVLALLPFGVAFRAFVLSRLWAWFLVPLGVPALAVGHALGLIALAVLVMPGRTRPDTRPAFDQVLDTVTLGFLLPAMCWLFGWVGSLWMLA